MTVALLPSAFSLQLRLLSLSAWLLYYHRTIKADAFDLTSTVQENGQLDYKRWCVLDNRIMNYSYSLQQNLSKMS